MKNYKYDKFIPKSFVIGISDKGAGFPTMKDEKGKWTNLSVFEGHCGFKPYAQKDSVKELNKTVLQNVREIENRPTGGFRLLSLKECVYFSDWFKGESFAKLRDPRGWDISVDISTLQSLLERNGVNLKDGELVGVELMYSWPDHGIPVPFSVVPASKCNFDIQDATDEFVSARDRIASIKPSEYEVGKVYTSKTSKLAGSRYMYLGKHDVYSVRLQLKAVMKKDYSDLDEFLDDRTDITGKDRFVFYCLDVKKSKREWGVTDNTPGVSPYYITSSLSKLFDRVESGIDLTKFTMYNSDLPCTYENVREDMERSALFNMIDFSAQDEYVKVDYDAAEDVFARLHGYDYAPPSYRAFPFSCESTGIFMRSRNVEPGCVSCRDVTFVSHENSDKKRLYEVQEPRMAGEYYYGYGNSRRTYSAYIERPGEKSKDVFKRMFKEVEPEVRQYVFVNGKRPTPLHNLLLNRRTKL